MRGLKIVVCFVAAMALAAEQGTAQPSLSDEDVVRGDAAVRTAFDFLYKLPSDTAGVAMGSWVVDSAATTRDPDRRGRWRIVVTKLADTGQGLKLEEMLGEPGTSPAQLAASMAAMQQLEAKISRADAEASLEVVISVNEAEITVSGVSDAAERTTGVIPGAPLAVRVRGDWMRMEDRELEINYAKWSPATLLVGFGAFSSLEARRVKPNESLAMLTARARFNATPRGIETVAVTAQGNEDMIDRLVRETRWDVLARLSLK